MPRLFHLFIDILTTESFHLLCKEDFRGLWPGPWRGILWKIPSPQWGQDLPRTKRAIPPCQRYSWDNLAFPVSLLSSLSMRDGNMACNRLALCLHSGIEAFSSFWALWYSCPRSTISTGIQLTRLLAGFSLFLKKPMHFNPLQVLADFFPRQPHGCLFTAHLQWVYNRRLKTFSQTVQS